MNDVAVCKPRALFVLDNLTISGAEKVAVNLLLNAKRQGKNWDGLIYMDDLIGADAMDVPLLSFAEPSSSTCNDKETFLKRLGKAVNRLRLLRKLAQNYDVLVGVTPPSMLWCALACIGSKAHSVAWIHYDLAGVRLEPFKEGRKIRDFLLFSLYTKFIPNCSRHVFISDAVMNSFGMKESCVNRVIHNIMEPKGFTVGGEGSDVVKAIIQDREAGKVPLLFMARIARQKQWEKAIETLEEIEKLCPGRFVLHFVGDGPEAAILSAFIKKSVVSGSIRKHGFQSNPMPILQAAPAILLTSLHEAWPTIILEAFHLGSAVFSFDCPSGPADMLGNCGERGFLSKTPSEMAVQIVKYFTKTDSIEAAEVRQRAKEYLNNFNSREIVEIWEQYFVGISDGRFTHSGSSCR